MPISNLSNGLRTGVCTSTNRPTTPYEGQVIYETDTDLVLVYNGTAWQQIAGGTAVGNSGLVYVTSATIGTTVSSVTVSSAFSTTYDNYKIIVTGGVGSATAVLQMTLGSTATGYYYGGTARQYIAVTLGIQGSNVAFWYAGESSTNSLEMSNDINNPFVAKNTTFNSVFSVARTDGYNANVGGYLANTTSYTAFTITPNSGTLTGGTITVYGYRKA